METPLSVYRKLANCSYSYLFESVEGGEKWARYSLIGLKANRVIKITKNTIEIHQDSKLSESFLAENPLDYIDELQKSYTLEEDPNLPKFNGGLVGYFSYDCVRFIEPKLSETAPPDTLGTPDALFMISEEVAVFDNLKNKLHLIILINSKEEMESANQRLDELEEKLREPLGYQDFKKPEKSISESDFISGFGEEDFKKSVLKAKKYIEDGDIMQVVCSQRMSIPFTADPVALYRSIRQLNPSPYMYYLNLDDFHIVGSSPEILARLEDNKVTVRPIAGTRRRGKDNKDDMAMEEEMVNDPKEIAEHLMLIDLGRNDVGKIAKPGSVEVTEKFGVERYSHVMHMVSNVEAELRDHSSAIDLFKATFPAGTVSGAPKIRAMEIIDEFEPVKRGIYGGAIGYLSWQGNMDMAIAIRTAVIKDEVLYIQAGGGWVADSIPELEWKESLNKGRAIFKAAELVQEKLEG
ncbi:anthranilate synthase component I [Gammaproteobacteria bacterium]|nr:anthranilate synthase component I [Gammaproteobacteria bacterium]MDB3994808.1 anthranilate synthase component I [Gammaproteobacteria bacterium]MDC0509385.1 anthranilate synthase component I [Gammaproteobacteria bacterium]MDC0577587.1 anthranilate synthase component I [Gammaproteobacteria bacterium]